MRVHCMLGTIAAGLAIAAVGCSSDKPKSHTPFFVAFKAMCIDTRLQLPALKAALRAAHAKEDPDVSFEDPKAVPSQMRGWHVEVAGQPFEVTIRTYDEAVFPYLNVRTLSCMVQSFNKKETSGIAGIRNWIDVEPTDNSSYGPISHEVFRYKEYNGKRVSAPLDRRDQRDKSQIWRVELSQFDGMRNEKPDLASVATAEISTEYESSRPFPMDFSDQFPLLAPKSSERERGPVISIPLPEPHTPASAAPHANDR